MINFKWKNNIIKRDDHAVLVVSKSRDGQRNCYYSKIDLDDIEIVKKLHWRVDPKGYIANWSREDGETIFTFLHRYLLDPANDEYVGHVNGDVLDNRKDNLQICGSHSCLAQRRVAALHGLRPMPNGTVIMKTVKGVRQIARFATKEEAISFADFHKARKTDHVELLTKYELNLRFPDNPLHHIHLRACGGYVAQGKSGVYLGYFKDLAKAISIRDAEISQWCHDMVHGKGNRK